VANTWLALLRGVNVVGANPVPMKELAAAFERNGFRSVRTYIQSGNVVFGSRSRAPLSLQRRIEQLVFAERPRDPDLEGLTRANVGREKFQLTGRVFYLCTPDGFAESVLRSRIERCLGVAATARNWRTANELMKMLDQAGKRPSSRTAGTRLVR
jgi:uncharacterized protein (DUF1697 family)